MLPRVRRRFVRLVGIAALVCIFVAGKRWLSSPRVVHLKAPMLLSGVDLDVVAALRPSPDGRFVALEGAVSTGTTWNGKPLIAIFSVEQKSVVARLPVPWQGDCVWDRQNRLWTPHGNGWDVWGAPWKTPARVEAHINPKIWKSIGAVMLAFEPNSQTVALSQSHEASLPVQIELWRAGKRLCSAKIAESDTQAGGLGTNIRAPRWSPDGSQLAFSLVGATGVDSDGPHELWVFDVPSKQLRMVARGDIEEWVMADPLTQDTEPTWSRDGKTLFYGDEDFGINATSVQGGNEYQILAAAWSGHSPATSPSNRALAFERYAGNGDPTTLNVAGTDGSWFARGPRLDSNEQWAWNPARDELFFLAPGAQGATSLWAWDAKFPNAGP